MQADFKELTDSQIDEVISNERAKRAQRYGEIKVRGNRAFDTETKNGYVYLISSDTKQHLFLDEPTDPENTFLLFEWLLKNGRDYRNWFFNISFDFQSIVKPYAVAFPSLIKQALQIGRLELHNGSKRLTVKWVDGKYFQISDNGGHRGRFYDVANFLNGSLDECAKEFLNISKSDIGTDIDIEHPEKYSKFVLLDRCYKDALLTKQLADILVDTVHNELGLHPRKWNSKASLSKEILKSLNVDALKPFRSEDREVIRYAWRSFKGGIFQTKVKGKVTKPDEVDIVSAYPNVLRNLPDLTSGHWEYVDGNTQFTEMKDGMFYGFYKVFRQFDGYSPLRVRNEILYPETDNCYIDYVTLPEIYYMLTYKLPFFVIDGYEFHFDSIPSFPFRAVIDKLFDIKQHTDKQSQKAKYWLTKVVLNAIYGCLCENKHGIGLYFNPVYASYITSLTRIYISSLSRDYFKDVYSIATDGITGKLKNKIPQSTAIGHIEKKHELPATSVYVQNGLITDTDGHLLKMRGMTLTGNTKVRFTADGLVFKGKKVYKLKESLIQHKAEAISVFKHLSKEISYSDDKRIWVDTPSANNIQTKLIKSLPLDDISIGDEYPDLYNSRLDDKLTLELIKLFAVKCRSR